MKLFTRVLEFLKGQPRIAEELDVAVSSLTFHKLIVTQTTGHNEYQASDGKVTVNFRTSTPLARRQLVTISLDELGWPAKLLK